MKVKRKLKKRLAAVLPELVMLRHGLRNFQSMDPLPGIICFFNEVSKWHDRGIEDLIETFKKHEELVEKLSILQAHFVNAGRDRSGMNRTKPGQRVTADDVFLGAIYGLFTKPVYFWEQKKDDPKGGWGFSGMEHLNSYDVVSDQAHKFMDSHINPMIEIINSLEKAAA